MVREWIGKVVDSEDLTRHDKWLCMMMPRLKLLRELLSKDGSIWISIDDNEQANLKGLMDECFGEDNFLANIVWQKRTSPDTRLAVSTAHDYIMAYAKGFDDVCINKMQLTASQKAAFKNPDDDPRGPWTSTDFTAMGWRPNQMYKIKTPAGVVYEPPPGRCWANIQTAFKELVEDNQIWFGKNGDSRPRVKTFLSQVDGIPTWTWWDNTEVGHNQEGTKELNSLLGAENPFHTPKPTRLIQRIVQLTTDEDSIVLDSFAGSGTTAHAVLKSNAEQGGHRRFILIEMEDYADSLTAERVRRVINGVSTAKTSVLMEGIGGTFSYFDLGDPIVLESILSGKKLPSYEELARYVL